MSIKHPEIIWFFIFTIIPIIIHLIHFKKRKKTFFSSLQFLKSVYIKQRNVKKVQHLVLLLTRILYLCFLILAFIQLFSKKDNLISAKENIIYIDNSNSMSLQGEKGELFSQAKEDAIKLIKSSPLNSSFVILSNDIKYEHQSILNRAIAIKTIENLKLSSNSFSTLNFEKLASEKKNIYLFSDFQKLKTLTQLKNNSNFNIFKYTPEKKDNLYIDSVWFSKPNHQFNDNCELNIRINNSSEIKYENCELKINLNNSPKTIFTSIETSTSKIIKYNFIEKNKIENKIQLTINDLNAPFDNNFYFNYSIISSVNILNIEGESASKNIEEVYNLEDNYKLFTKEESKITEDDFSNINLIILNGIINPSDFIIEKLSRLQKENVSIFLLPGKLKTEHISKWSELLTKLEIGTFSNINKESIAISEINSKTPFFKNVLKSKSETVKVNYPIIKQSLTLKNNLKNSTLIKLKNKQPLLIKNLINNTYLYCSSLDTSFSSLNSNALFPIVFLRAAELSVKNHLFYTYINNPESIKTTISIETKTPFYLKSDNIEFIPLQSFSNKQLTISLKEQSNHNSILNPGFYQLMNKKKLIQYLSINSSKEESELIYFSNDEITDIFKPVNFNDTKMNTKPIKIEIQKENNLWHLFLILSLILMLTEIVLIKFWKD